MRCLRELSGSHELLSVRRGTPIVRDPSGQLLSVQRDGQLAASFLVERVQSYLNVQG